MRLSQHGAGGARALVLTAAITSLALTAAPPVNAYAVSGSAPEPTRPHAMTDSGLVPGEAPLTQPRRAAAPPAKTPARTAPANTNQRLQRETFGFALGSSLGDATVGYPSWDFSLLSTVAYFGLHVNADGTLAQDSDMTTWNSSALTDMVATAHAHGTRVVVTIVLQDWNSSQPTMCGGLQPSSAATTVAQTAAQVKAKGVDGVNVDYEGYNHTCANGQTTRTQLVAFVQQLRSALPSAYISVDTYASSAADSGGFFDVGGLAAAADSLFVMAYDLDQSNNVPDCPAAYCLSPVAPLIAGGAYKYNDTSVVAQYLATIPASKVILGIPYYGRKACVATATAYQPPQPSGSEVGDTYLDASTENTASTVTNFAAHRDRYDTAGAERWDTWYNTSLHCTRELYWDDASSLAPKYDLVNSNDLRGVGFWNLNFGGGAPELWNLIQQKFTRTLRIGGALASGPDAAAWDATRADVVVRGTDNQVWHAWSTDSGQTFSWQSLGGQTYSDPSIVSWTPGRLDVFARGTDNQLWHRWFDGAWHPWEPLGGRLSSGPDAASWSAGRLDVVVRGTDNHAWHRWWDGIAWRGWENLGGVLASDPSAVSTQSNALEVFVQGTDRQLWHRWWDGRAWSSWNPLGGILVGSPDATSWGSGRVDVFVRGTDNQLWHRYWQPGGVWSPWTSEGGSWSSDPGAAAPAPGTLEIFERGLDGALWEVILPQT